MAVVLDTGPIYSSIDRSDPDHKVVRATLDSAPRPHLVVVTVLVEVDHWLRKYLDVSAMEAFAADLASGRYELTGLEPSDVARATELERIYEDARLGFVDASIVAVCERIGVTRVVTFDDRHFRMVRPAHCAFLEILPGAR